MKNELLKKLNSLLETIYLTITIKDKLIEGHNTSLDDCVSKNEVDIF